MFTRFSAVVSINAPLPPQREGGYLVLFVVILIAHYFAFESMLAFPFQELIVITSNSIVIVII